MVNQRVQARRRQLCHSIPSSEAIGNRAIHPSWTRQPQPIHEEKAVTAPRVWWMVSDTQHHKRGR